MKHTLQIEAMHSLRVGELAELETKLNSLQIEHIAAKLNPGAAGSDQEEEYRDSTRYTVVDGVAVLRVDGPLISTPTWISSIMGYVSYPELRRWLVDASADETVTDILLMIGSPGGSVFGVTDAAETIRKVGGVKPIYAFSNKMCCSGAYWLASAAKEIIVTPEAEIGSIGVIVTHLSYEKQLENDGIKATLIRSSELKAIGGPFKDLTDKEIAHIQSQVDTFNNLFRDHVQTTRPQIKFSAMNGQTYIGVDAMQQGLVDRVLSYDSAIDYIKAARPKTTQVGGYSMKMTAEQLRVALDAGQTLETLGLSQEEVDEILVTVVEPEGDGATPEPEAGEGDGATPEPEAGEGDGSVDTMTAELTAELAATKQLVEAKDAAISELSAQLEAATKTADKMRDVVVGVINNRRIALGMSEVDMSKFSLESVMQDYEAVTEQFSKSFKPGGIFAQKKVEEPKTVVKTSTEAGLMQAAAIQ